MLQRWLFKPGDVLQRLTPRVVGPHLRRELLLDQPRELAPLRPGEVHRPQLFLRQREPVLKLGQQFRWPVLTVMSRVKQLPERKPTCCDVGSELPESAKVTDSMPLPVAVQLALRCHPPEELAEIRVSPRPLELLLQTAF